MGRVAFITDGRTRTQCRKGVEEFVIDRRRHADTSANTTLRTYVEERLAGAVVAPSGASVPRPGVVEGPPAWPAKGSAMGQGPEPEQIARRLPIDFPDDRRCASATKPSISPSWFRAGECCAAS